MMRSAMTRWPVAALPFVVAACAVDTIQPDVPKAVEAFPIAPYEIHEECAQLVPGDRLDFHFEATSPVIFQLYYKEGVTFIAPMSQSDVREFGGLFTPQLPRRYCLQWESGQQGALVDYRIRWRRGSNPS
ncbi:MAG: hypothetical protein ABI624_01945 [Casimicrobiaceae bacterium]